MLFDISYAPYIQFILYIINRCMEVGFRVTWINGARPKLLADMKFQSCPNLKILMDIEIWLLLTELLVGGEWLRIRVQTKSMICLYLQCYFRSLISRARSFLIAGYVLESNQA